MFIFADKNTNYRYNWIINYSFYEKIIINNYFGCLMFVIM